MPEPYGDLPRLIPELVVLDLDASLRFYTAAGFEISYARDEDAFVMLIRDGVVLMLEAADGPERRLTQGPLVRPLGVGLNLQIEVDDIAELHDRLTRLDYTIVLGLEQRWYRIGDHKAGNHQFVAADPDGYLLRFFEDLGTRPLHPVPGERR
jgi:catechol 2,3-dioxygenase-like lactoylglutathione lyase family enzyme